MNDQNNTPDPVTLGKMILEIVTSTWVETEQFDAILKYMNIPEGSPKVDCTQRLLALIKRLPQKVLDQETRDKIIEAGQDYLDSVIEAEEDNLDEEQ